MPGLPDLLSAIIHSQSCCLALFEGSLLSNPDVWRVANLLVFVAILVYILRNKIGIGKVFDQRGQSIVKDLEEARREKQEAQQRLDEVLDRLKKLDQEVAEIKAQAEVEAQKEDERLRLAAEADADKIQQTARREIEGAMKAARAELRAFVSENAVTMAEGLIRREMRPEDSSRILSEYARELAGKADGGHG